MILNLTQIQIGWIGITIVGACILIYIFLNRQKNLKGMEYKNYSLNVLGGVIAAFIFQIVIIIFDILANGLTLSSVVFVMILVLFCLIIYWAGAEFTTMKKDVRKKRLSK